MPAATGSFTTSMPGAPDGRKLLREAGGQESLGGGVTAVDGEKTQYQASVGMPHAIVSQCPSHNLEHVRHSTKLRLGCHMPWYHEVPLHS